MMAVPWSRPRRATPAGRRGCARHAARASRGQSPHHPRRGWSRRRLRRRCRRGGCRARLRTRPARPVHGGSRPAHLPRPPAAACVDTGGRSPPRQRSTRRRP
ncbi:hypothetical protein I4F81_009166 [Pyropia yezoensis]|uniref:Uncharacterized protein n=1 Tax=Pyropia yezoensis TaxID=2788 RepID=A0ACC3C963_PYRYE|nr:hypothetical protein I4F81_009166 [Neopyropia yezoensis]